MGGSTIVNVSDWSLIVTAGGKIPGYAMLVGILVRYTRLYIIDRIMGASLLILFNGPSPTM